MTDTLTNIEGMTPVQVADALKRQAIQLGSDIELFWASMARNVVKHMAYLALPLENDDEVREHFMKAEGCRPYSLQAIQKLSMDEIMAQRAITVVMHLANLNDDAADPLRAKMLRKAVSAGTWVATQYHGVVSEETKLRWKSSIEALLSVEDNELTAEEVLALTKKTRGMIATAQA